MPRRYYPRRSYGSRDKYSIQQNTFRLLLTPQAPQNNIVCVPDTTTEGMRKVKHLTISLGNITGSGVIYWALIFCSHLDIHQIHLIYLLKILLETFMNQTNL